jgi:flagellin
MLSINTNSAALSAQRNVAGSQSAMAQSVQRLSSGMRVNTAKDDAAGLAIATRLEAQSRGFSAAVRNANDGISLLQVSDSAMSSISDNLQRMRELTVQASSGTYGTSDVANLQTEFKQLADEVNLIAAGAKFNGQTLLGAAATSVQVGADSGDTRSIAITNDITAAVSTTAGTAGGVDMTALGFYTATAAAVTTADADAALSAIDNAFTDLNTARAEIGSHMSKFDRIVSDLSVKIENTEAAKGRIMDADYAVETAKLSRNQILQQAGTAMLAQANSMPQSVLSLLRG